MKKRLFALALLLTGLASCNSDEEVVKVNTDYVEPGTALIATNFYSVKTPTTKADEPKRMAAFDDEKKIESIAFFVQVGDDNNLQLFQSTKTLGTIDGLLEQPKETVANTPGSYTAKFKMKMNGNQKVVMVALANYAENGLDLSTINTRKALEEAMSNAITDQKNPEKPLLMLGTVEKNDLKEGEAAEVNFKMDRLVARVDVVNEAFNANAAKGFRLKSAQVLNGKSQSALLPDMTSSIEVVDEMLAKTMVVGYNVSNGVEANDDDIVYQRLDTLYMYENANTTNATAIQINGTFNGTPVAQRVEFMKEDPATGVKTQLPIGRNNLYTIKIRPSQDSTTVSFGIEVEDWTNAEGDTITIEPKKEAPVLKDLKGTLTSAVIDGKRIDIDVANVADLAGTVTFTAEGNQDSQVTVKYVGRSGAAWLDDQDAVKQGDLQGFTKASPILKREYTIDLSKAATELSSNATVPSDALVLIQNANAATICDTIRICFRPDYDKNILGAKPVLMKGNDGKEYFWAPVNVGAKNANNKAVTTANTDITADVGQLFQWGRKYGFAATNDATKTATDTTGIETKGRPVRDDLNKMSKWDGKFIYSTSDLKYNWLQINGDGNANPEAEGMVKGAWYQQLWNANEGKDNAGVVKTTTDPCPQGWRVPTQAEWIAIGAGKNAAVSGTSWDSSNLRLTIPGAEEGKNLLLPAAGLRNYSTGASNNQGSFGSYWSSSVPAASTYASNVGFNSAGKLSPSTSGRALGFSVRCVQE